MRRSKSGRILEKMVEGKRRIRRKKSAGCFFFNQLQTDVTHAGVR